ncbi:Uncharacterised protein [Enterobacter cloacae]|nr:Uncharacterised protein [Enterobacter cloacae]
MDPAGGRWRHGEDLIATVGAANWLALHRLILRQIRFSDEPAVLLHLFGNLVGNRPFVEGVRAMLRNQLQAFGKVLLHQLIALLQRLSVFPEDRLAVFMVRNDFAAVGFKVIGQGVVHHKAVACQLNGRLDHFVQRHRAVFFQRQREACDGARRAGRKVRGQRFFTVRVALIVKEHIAGGLSWRHFAEVDSRRLPVFGAQHHKAAAAQIPRLRVCYRQRIADRHRGIYRITALFENIDAHFRCQRIHRGHHPVRGPHGMKHIFLHAIRDRRSRRRVSRHAKCTACHQRSDGDPAQKGWFHHYCSPGEGSHIPRLSLVHNS